jgi:hypothetical protein
MKDFLLIFRRENYDDGTQLSSQGVQEFLQPWVAWIGTIAAQNKLVDAGNRLSNGGRVVKSKLVTDGPYVEIKESIGGYTIIKANSFEEAVELSKGCPVLLDGGCVEVREIIPTEHG